MTAKIVSWQYNSAADVWLLGGLKTPHTTQSLLGNPLMSRSPTTMDSPKIKYLI